VSGNKLDFNVYILDQDGNIYKSDSKSKATLDSAGVTSPNNSNSNSSKNGTKTISEVILLNNAVIATEGVYQFRGVELRADPGSSPSLNLAFAGLQTFGNPMSFA
jgi:urocanate hydratase